MNTLTLSRLLGWFSLVLGGLEIAAPGMLASRLGLRGGRWLVRGFGAREVAAGLMVLARPDATLGPAARIAGDALDIAVLLPALLPSNPKSGAARVAFVLVAGITALDIFCTAALASDEKRRAQTAQRTRIAPGLGTLPAPKAAA